MSLNTMEQIRQVWGSHMPLLKAVMRVLRPARVVECGCGRFSTPIIQEYADQSVTIEHDLAWANVVQGEFPPTDSHQWIVKETTAKNGVQRKDIPPEVLRCIDEWYQTVNVGLSSIDLAFVDTITAARAPAIQRFSHDAEMIVIHDLEKDGWNHYSYHLIESDISRFHKYMFMPNGQVNGHQIPWSMLLAREPVNVKSLLADLLNESVSLWGTMILTTPPILKEVR